MRGIRWITGIPLGFWLYKFLVSLNLKFVVFLASLMTFVPNFIWEIEGLFVSGMVLVYLCIVITYFFLPKDDFALINNTKVRFLYWALSFWTVMLLLSGGVNIYNAFHEYKSGMIYQILYSPIMIFSMWMTHKGIAIVDFKHNEPAREYVRIQEQQDQRNIIDVTS